jgi:hypothetical protein
VQEVFQWKEVYVKKSKTTKHTFFLIKIEDFNEYFEVYKELKYGDVANCGILYFM